MATEREQAKVWGQKSKIDEELDYFTELALHESERWMQAVTRKKFKYPDDPRKSLEDGILMCELLNGLKPGTIRKVNRLPTPLAGMDNVNVFLEACSKTFGLKDAQLFHPCDLEDLSNRAFADSEEQLKYETDRRLRNVVVTIYWLGRTVQPWYKGPHLDCSAFSDLIGYHHPKVSLTESPSENILSEELHTRQESCDSLDRSSGYSSYRGDSKTSSSSYVQSQHHSRQVSTDSVDRGNLLYIRNDNAKSSFSSDVFEDDPVTPQLRDDSYKSFVSEDLPLTRRSNADKRQSENITPDTGETDNSMPIPQEYRRRTSHGNRFAEQRYSATFDSPYTPPGGATSPSPLSHRWKNDAVYQSTPQLNRSPSHDDHNRFRFGDNKLDRQSRSSTSSDNIDGAKPGERRESYVPPGQAVRRTSTTHADPMQFVHVGGSKLSQKAKEVIEAMEEQKKMTKALEHEEMDWHSNLSSWKSKMRTKNKAAHERTEEIEKTLEDPEPRRGKAKTFGEMMAERERRKSTGRNFYPYTEEDVGALGGVNRLNSAPTSQDSAPATSVTPVYRKSLDNNSQNNDHSVSRRAEMFESDHSTLGDVKTNNDQPSSRVTESPVAKPHNRYTVSQNARVRPNEVTRDRGREMMERRKEESESQEFEEKTIKISQKPNGEKGFGFTIGGGKEHCSPIVIEKVSLGSAADAYGLVEGDEIAAINGVSMDDSYQGSVLYVINQAVRTGLMELKIRRYPFAESDDSEDEREQEQQRQEELERQRREEEEQQRLKQEQEQEEQRRRELEEQQRQEKQREEQLRLEQQRQLKRQQLEKQREELRQQKLQQLEQQRLKQQKQEPLPRRRRQQEQQPQEQQLPEKQHEWRRREQQQHKEQQQRAEQQQEEEHQQIEQQWLEKQQQEQRQEQQQLKEEQWQVQQKQQQQLQELEQNRVEQQWQEQQQQQQQWEQLQWEQQQQWAQQQLDVEQENEPQPTEQLRQEEQQLVEDDRRDEVPVSHTEMNYHEMELPEVPSEPPPPLPSMPPPAPNWNTFPTATGELASTDDDFFDQNDLLPDLGTEAATEEEKMMARDKKEAPVTPETGCVRTDILRRKSQFLGLENCEEYHTLQTDKQQKEKLEWERIEATDSILKDLRSVADTRPPENSWQPLEGATRDNNGTSYSSYNAPQSANVFDPSSAYDLEQREMDIIANLERDDEASRRLGNGCHDDIDAYQDQGSSRSTDSVHSSTVASIEARVTQDMRSTPSTVRMTHRSPTERRNYDVEGERRRMEKWDAEQEEKRKQLYEAEQQSIRKKHEEDLRKSQQLEEERRRELAEQEEIQQRRFDELRRQAEVENQRQQEEQEKIRQEEEKRRIRQQQQEEEKRKRRQMEILAEREAQLKREEAERVRKQAEEQQRREEEERVRKANEEQRRREEERVRKREQEQREKEEEKVKALREREEQLRQMEERIRRETEELRLEKERLEMEKTNRQKPWSIQQTTTDAPPEYSAPPVPTHTMPSYDDTKVDEVRLSYVPQNNVYQDQYGQPYEPNHTGNISPMSQPQFHIEFKTEPNRIFTLHQRQDDYSYRGNNGISPRTSLEKLPRRELPIQPKPSLREEMGLRPEPRRMYGSQSNVALRSPTGSDASLPDTGREAALRSSRLPSGNSSYYPESLDGGTRRHSEYQRRPEPVDNVSPKSLPPWVPPLKPVPSTVHPDGQVSPTQLTKAELHQIAAVPRPRFNDNWIKPAEDRQRRPAPRRSEIMRQNINHPGEHWLFEEAERRRLAAQQGTQHLQKRQDPSQYQFEQQWWPQESPAPSGGSNGYSVEYSGDSGYGLPQRYDFGEQPQSLESPAYRASYDDGNRYDRYGNQPPLVHPTPTPTPTSTSQTIADPVPSPRYIDTPAHNHPYSTPKPNSPSYQYPPTSTQQYHYPHSDNASLSPNSYPPYPDQKQPSRVSYPSAEPVHSRTSSQNSEPPPVPPKPPRLLASSENSQAAEHVIAVSGYQACANCGDALGDELVQKRS